MPELLVGLRPDSYAGYLGGLGLLRILNEQRDATAQGFWQRGHFVLESQLDEKALLDFLLVDYAPTPIASPWNVLGGFQRASASHPRFALAATQEARFHPYRETLARVERYLENHSEWPRTPEQKADLVRAIHAAVPVAGRRWVETVATVEQVRFRYGALAFAGGCDGALEFSTTFMRALVQLFLSSPQRAGETTWSRARSLLRACLFGEPTDHLQRETFGAIDPGTARAPAGSSDGVAEPLSNPWCFVLAMEGLLTSKVLQVRRQMNGGGCSVITREGKFEAHAPVWRSPMSSQQLSEAAAGENLAVPEYQRFGLLQRNGRAHFVLPLGSRSVSNTGPLERAGKWLRHHRPEWSYQHGDIGSQTTRQLEELGKLRLGWLQQTTGRPNSAWPCLWRAWATTWKTSCTYVPLWDTSVGGICARS